MTSLPPFVPGTLDTRNFRVEGHDFHVARNADGTGEVAFWGGGRDGDYVGADDPHPAVLERALAGIAGLSQRWLGWGSSSPELVETVERRMLELAGTYQSIWRQIWGNLEAARGALAVSRAPMTKRNVYISGPAFSIDIDLPLEQDGIVTDVAHGNPQGVFVEQTLTELGAPIACVPGPGYDKAGHYVIPARVLAAFLDKALVVNGAGDVRLFDNP